MNGAPIDCGKGILDEARFVERVSVDRYLNIQLVCHVETGINGCRSRSPVFVQLEADRSREDLFAQWWFGRAIALSEKTKVHWILISSF